MSFISVMLSRREVVLSLALVGFILFLALMLAITPMIRKRWKRMQAQRKARQVAKIAQLKKKKAAARIAYQKKQAAAEMELQAAPVTLEELDGEESPDPGAPAAPAPVMTMQAAPAPAPASAAAVTVSPMTPAAPPATEGSTATGTPAPFHEEQPEEEASESDLQSILDSVFVDEEANARYEVLLRDTEVMSTDELVEMATKLNADLRARRNSPAS